MGGSGAPHRSGALEFGAGSAPEMNSDQEHTRVKRFGALTGLNRGSQVS